METSLPAAVVPHDLVEELDTIQLVRKNYVQPLTVKWVQDQGNSSSSSVSSNVDIAVTLNPGDPPVNFEWIVVSPTDVGGTLVVDVNLEKVKKENLSFFSSSFFNSIFQFRARRILAFLFAYPERFPIAKTVLKSAPTLPCRIRRLRL